jgi:hypothetical protein
MHKLIIPKYERELPDEYSPDIPEKYCRPKSAHTILKDSRRLSVEACIQVMDMLLDEICTDVKLL